MNIYSLLSIVFWLFPNWRNLAIAQNDWRTENWKSIIQEYQALSQSLNSMQTRPYCFFSDQQIQSANCTMAGLCKLYNFNHNQLYLYKNSAGEGFLNYELIDLLNRVDNCVAQEKVHLFGKFLQPEGTTNEKRVKNKLHARSELLKAVAQKNFQKEFLQYEQAVAELELAQVSPEATDAVNGWSLESETVNLAEIYRDIDKAIAQAKIKNFPPNIKSLIVKSVLANYTQSPNNLDFLLEVLNTKDKTLQQTGEQPLFQDPFFDFRLLINQKMAGGKQQVLNNQKHFKDQMLKAQQIFHDTQQSILSLLDQKIKKFPQHQAAFEEMKKRVSTTRLHLPDQNLERLSSDCPSPNAFYRATDHSITICPQLLDSPEANLRWTMAHEIGHSIDPCTLSKTLFQVTDLKRHSYLEKKIPTKEEVAILAQKGITYWRGFEQTETTLFQSNFPERVEQYLEKTYSHFQIKTFSTPIALIDNPAQSLLNCLAGENSLQARAANLELGKANLDQAIDIYQKSGASTNNPEYQELLTVRENFPSFHQKHGACSFLPERSQMQEAWSDHLATEDLATWIPTQQSSRPAIQLAFESMGDFLASSCKFGPLDIWQQAKNFLQAHECEGKISANDSEHFVIGLEKASRILTDVHSAMPRRLDKIFMAHPQIRMALGCKEQDHATVYCE